MKTYRKSTRRNQCYFIAKRACQLNVYQATDAWVFLSEELSLIGEKDVPKFHDLLSIIRRATITGRQRYKPKTTLKPI